MKDGALTPPLKYGGWGQIKANGQEKGMHSSDSKCFGREVLMGLLTARGAEDGGPEYRNF